MDALRTYLFIIAVVASVIAIPTAVHFYLVSRKADKVAEAERALADGAINKLVDELLTQAEIINENERSLHYEYNQRRLHTAQISDLTATVRRLERSNEAHVSNIELLTTEVTRLEDIQEADRIQYVKDVLGAEPLSDQPKR